LITNKEKKIMDIKVSITPTESTGKIKGYAKVTFEDKYVLDNVTIRENRDEELYVKMPQANYRKNENGVTRLETKDSFYCKNKEVREQLNNTILHAYSHGSGEYELDGQLELKGVRAAVYEKGVTKGFASVDLGDFVLPTVYIQGSPDGTNYLTYTATQRKFTDKDTGEESVNYVDNFKPITKNSAAEMKNAVLQAYDAAVEKKNNSAKQLQEQSKGR
jgi:DNA-binding cell septation regulator SpoVG